VIDFNVSPSEFWNMTPKEFWWLMGEPVSKAGLTQSDRDRLLALSRKHKDGNYPRRTSRKAKG
jgi:hypothetical protein